MIIRPTGTLNLSVTRAMQVLNTNNVYILCQTSSGPININLPRISSISGVPNSTLGFRIFITDDNNNAAANNITITPNAADTINGSGAPVVLNTNGVTGHILISGLTQWDFSIGSSGAGGGDAFSLLFTQTADKAVPEDSAETTLIGAGVGSLTIAANTLEVGDVITGEMWGYNVNTLSRLVRARFGGFTLATPTLSIAASSGSAWHFLVQIAIRSIAGNNATAYMVGEYRFDDPTTPNNPKEGSITPLVPSFTFDKSINQAFNITAETGMSGVPAEIRSFIFTLKKEKI